MGHVKKDLAKIRKRQLKTFLMENVRLFCHLLHKIHYFIQYLVEFDGECFVDSSNQILSGYNLINDTSMTIEKCKQLCRSKEFLFAGVESGNECHCGNDVPMITAPSRECYLQCAGDQTQKCGGHWRVNVYSIAPTTTTSITETTAAKTTTTTTTKQTTTSSITKTTAITTTPITAKPSTTKTVLTTRSVATTTQTKNTITPPKIHKNGTITLSLNSLTITAILLFFFF